MSVNLGNNAIRNILLGDQPISKVMKNGEQIWPLGEPVWEGTAPYCCLDFSQATIEPVAPNPNGVTAQFLRASTATVVDHEGKIVTVPANVPRFQGARYVNNKLAGYDWSLLTAASVTNLGNGVWEIVTDGAVTGSRARIGDTVSGKVGQHHIARVDVKVVSAPDDAAIHVRLYSNIFETYYTPDEFSDWKTVSLNGASIFDQLFIEVGLLGLPSAPVTIQVRNAQIEEGLDGETIPNKYVNGPTFLPYTYDNTVDADGIVTEGENTPIPGITYLNEPSVTNEIGDSCNFPYNTNDGVAWYGAVDGDGGVLHVAPAISYFPNGTASVYTDCDVAGGVVRYKLQPINLDRTSVYTLSLIFETTEDSVEFKWGVLDGGTGGTTWEASGFYRYRFKENDVATTLTTNPITHKVKILTENGPNGGRLVQVDSTFDSSAFLGTSTILHIYPFDSSGIVVNSKNVIHGVQLTLGKNASSFIITAGAPGTRDADKLSYTNVDINEDVSFLVDQESLYEAESYANPDICLINAAGTDPVIRTSGYIAWIAVANTGLIYVKSSDVITQERTRTVVSRTASQAIITHDGKVKVNQNSGLPMPHSVSDTYEIGHWSRTGDVYAGKFHRAMLFNKALSEEEAIKLSSINYVCPEDK